MRPAHLHVALRHLVNKVMKKLAGLKGFLRIHLQNPAKVIRIV
jgi:hypothetical protein